MSLCPKNDKKEEKKGNDYERQYPHLLCYNQEESLEIF